MNYKPTTPVLKRFTTSSTIVAMAVVMTFSSSIAVYADKFDDQISNIQNQINGYQSQATALAQQADSLQRAVATLQAQQDAIQALVDLSQAKHDQLVAQIKETEDKIAKNQDLLGETISNLYVDNTVSPVEMLASSKSIGDYLDQQEYRSSVRDQVEGAIKEIKALKKSLEAKQIEVERVLADQKAQVDSLNAKKAEQANLLAETQGNEAAYQGLIGAKNSEVANLRAQQAAAIRSFGTGANSPTGLSITFKNRVVQDCGVSGYSYCGYAWDDVVDDPWGLGYTKECVHYTADTLARRGYYIPYKLFSGRGNAYQWPGTVSANGVATVDNSPSKNAIVYMPIGGLGHVGVVEEVYGDGWVKVSQMNFPFGGYYSTMDLQVTSNLKFMHFNR